MPQANLGKTRIAAPRQMSSITAIEKLLSLSQQRQIILLGAVSSPLIQAHHGILQRMSDMFRHS